MQKNSFLLELCIRVYQYHEVHGEAILSAKQTSQLNFCLMSDAGNFTISFPVPGTMVIFNDDYVIEYIHDADPIVKVRKQLVTVLDEFNQADFQGKAGLIFGKGEYLSTDNVSGKEVDLYAMQGFLVEVFYNSSREVIEGIEVVKDPLKLRTHLDHIRINDLLNSS